MKKAILIVACLSLIVGCGFLSQKDRETVEAILVVGEVVTDVMDEAKEKEGSK